MKRSIIQLLILIFFAAVLTGCSKGEKSQDVKILNVMTHDSFSISENLVTAFEKEHGVNIRFLKSGDAGAALNQAILSRENPMADIFYGIDNTFMSRALKADIFEPYNSPMLKNIDESLKLDPQNRLLPVDYGDVCLNFDKAWFKERGVRPPESLEDLIKPEYQGLTVVENPATSSPGLVFLLATIGHFGEDGYLDYWKNLRNNGVLITDGWEDAYWGQFSAASKGVRPIVVSYASSPPAEVHFSEKPLDEAPTAAVVGPGTTFRQIEFVGIIKGTKHMDLAQKLVDFMLDKTFQEDIPLQMFVFPVNRQAQLPPVFVKHATLSDEPILISPDLIARNREAWIESWTITVLR
ncbi:MAG TPA: thiamine ABC transporter substrate-binding protein [Deltaproteobacteria bacterium]|nr:thiamine ABC transporter substrate-binding protein [Deltaproteobacteria bacterium]